MRVSTVCLSSCCGCHMALVNLGEDLLGPLKDGGLIFSPVLMDAKQIEKCELALLEGGVRNEENIQVLREIRANADVLIALGTCAAFGGVPGPGSAYATMDLLVTSYNEHYRPQGSTKLTPREEPIDAYVDVDYYIPGCPPPLPILGNALKQMFDGEEPSRVDLPVCAECQRIAKREVQSDFKRTLN